MENRNAKNTMVPAVHPRYRAVYTNLYEKEKVRKKHTIGIRMFFAISIMITTIFWRRNEQELFTQMVYTIENNDEWILHTLDWFDTLGHNWYNSKSIEFGK